jgi:hypothetical protein
MEVKMENKNEITVTFNISDSLLNTLANFLLISNGPASPIGVPAGLLAAIQGGQPQPTPERSPIGFSRKRGDK